MTMIKRGVCMHKVTVSETLWTCRKCGHRDVGSTGASGMICPNCGEPMHLSSASSRSHRKSR